MEKIDITKLSIVELKAMFFDRQMEMNEIKKELQLLSVQIQKKESVGEKVKQVFKQLPKGKK